MAEQTIVPCLWLDDQATQAAAFYIDTFREGRVRAESRFPETIDNPAGKPRGSVLTVDFEVLGYRFTALNGGPAFTIGPSISFFVRPDTEAEAVRLFEALSVGGKVMMPFGPYPWSPAYGWVADRYGVSWQVITGRRGAADPVIAPCLMFSGSVHMRAREALARYAATFPHGQVISIETYEEGEGDRGAIKHGRILAAGQELVAMDSHIDHGTQFSEAVSFQVMCRDQEEVDHYWAALSEGGETSVCGWVKDRFGVSWQVVPEAMADWMTHPDAGARDRAFAKMLTMTKLEIAPLVQALEGAE